MSVTSSAALVLGSPCSFPSSKTQRSISTHDTGVLTETKQDQLAVARDRYAIGGERRKTAAETKPAKGSCRIAAVMSL
jgi:hypothetical protein